MKNLILTFSGLLIMTILHSQSPQIQWEKNFGGAGVDCANKIIETSDGGYLVCGYTESEGAGGKDIYLIKLKSSGDVEWEKTFGGPDDDLGYDVIQNNEGDYVVAGSSANNSKGKLDFYVTVISPAGVEKWKELYGGDKDDEATNILQLKDSNYIIGGYTKSRGTGSSDIWILKTKGNKSRIEIKKNYGEDRKDELTDLVLVNDSTILMLGNTLAAGMNGTDFSIYVIDTERGKILGKQIVGGDNYDYGANIVKDGEDYVIGGSTMSGSAGLFDFYIFKLDFNFKPVWGYTYGDKKDEKANCMIKTTDGGFLLAGYTMSKGEGKSDGWLVKTSADGKKRWDETFGGADDDKINDIIATKDGGYIFVGTTKSTTEGKEDAWVVKVK